MNFHSVLDANVTKTGVAQRSANRAYTYTNEMTNEPTARAKRKKNFDRYGTEVNATGFGAPSKYS